jgi:glucan biosynthesis protein C
MSAETQTEEPTPQVRLHSLDGLRATMMLLGLVLHSACNYMDQPVNDAWRFRDAQTSGFFSFLVGFIHAWRMPIFMFIGGFFGALLVEKRGLTSFFRHRISRLGLPLVLFLPLMLPLTLSGFMIANLAQRVGFEAAWTMISNSPPSQFFTPFITIHLWFLYYLLIYSVLASLLTPISQKLPARLRPATLIGRVMRFPGSTLLLCLPVGWALKDSMLPGLLVPGVEWVPEKASFLAYAFLYLCGWALWSQKELLAKVASWPRILSSLALTLILFMAWGASLADPATFTSESRRFLVSCLAALVMWQAIWGFIGLFAQLTSRESPRIRYFVDASYWLYLIHLPFTIWIPGYLANKDWGSYAKFGLTLTITTLVGLITYDLFVRSTWIGNLLNGRRAPRALLKALQNRPLE